MAEDTKDDLESLNQDDGGETDETKTTLKDSDKQTPEEIAENYRIRAEKAEAKLKEKPPKEAKKPEDEPPKTINATPSPDEFAKEVRILANLSDEEIAEARDIQKAKGILLEEALKTKIFKAFQKELREEERKEKAKLGASKGSSQDEGEKKVFDTPATPEGNSAHKEAWKKATGK